MFDPTTKSDIRDMPVDRDEAINSNLVTPEEFDTLKKISIELYNKMFSMKNLVPTDSFSCKSLEIPSDDEERISKPCPSNRPFKEYEIEWNFYTLLTDFDEKIDGKYFFEQNNTVLNAVVN